MQGTFTVGGQKFRTQTQRRYVVVRAGDERFSPAVIKRTDSIDTARKEWMRQTYSFLRPLVIIDTMTGEDVTRR